MLAVRGAHTPDLTWMCLPARKYPVPKVRIINSPSAAVCSGMRDIQSFFINVDEWEAQPDASTHMIELKEFLRVNPTYQVFTPSVLQTPFPAHSEAMLPALVNLGAHVRARGYDVEPG